MDYQDSVHDRSEARGSTVEGVINEFCKRSFLHDFLFLRPTRVNDGEELTDLLVVLDAQCLCIQIKASGQEFSRSGQRLANWAVKRLRDAGRQAAGAIRKLAAAEVSATHPWRGNVEFKAGDLAPVSGIALVEYIGPPFALRAATKHRSSTGIPIHYFSLNDFLNLVDLLGTFADLVEYLRQRAQASEDVRRIIGNERDVLAAYLFDGHLADGLAPADVEGRWYGMTESERDAFDRRRRHDIFVDFYNGVIDELHNRDPEKSSYQPPELTEFVGDASDTSYLHTATELNKLPYAYRREIGQRLFQAAKAVKSSKEPRMFSYRNLGQRWVLTYLVTPYMDRTVRIRKLYWLVASAQVQYACESVIGIACPSLDSNQGYDCLFADKVTYDRDEVLKAGPTITRSSKIAVSAFPDPSDDLLLPADADFE